MSELLVEICPVCKVAWCMDYEPPRCDEGEAHGSQLITVEYTEVERERKPTKLDFTAQPRFNFYYQEDV